MSRERASYDDVVVGAPVTFPYMRYSIRGAHWFLAGALAALLKRSGWRRTSWTLDEYIAYRLCI